MSTDDIEVPEYDKPPFLAKYDRLQRKTWLDEDPQTPSGITQAVISACVDDNPFPHMVYKSYCIQKKWLDPADYPYEIVRDVYDNFSDVILILDEGVPLAGTRLVRDSHLGFQHEDQCNINLPLGGVITTVEVSEKLGKIKRESIREVTRFVSIAEGMRRRPMTVELIKGLYWYARRFDVYAYFVVIDLELLDLCERIDLPIHRISADFFCEGSDVMPGILFPGEIPQIRKGMMRYVLNEDSLDSTLRASKVLY